MLAVTMNGQRQEIVDVVLHLYLGVAALLRTYVIRPKWSREHVYMIMHILTSPNFYRRLKIS
jgi:hypothetical protein